MVIDDVKSLGKYEPLWLSRMRSIYANMLESQNFKTIFLKSKWVSMNTSLDLSCSKN